MEVMSKVELITEEMGRRESAIYHRLGDTTYRPHPPLPPPPFVPTRAAVNSRPHRVESGGYDWQNTTYPGPLYSQAGAYNQGQYLPYQRTEEPVARAAPYSHPNALPVIYNNASVMILPNGNGQPSVRVLNGERVFGPPPAFPPAYSAAPPQSTHSAIIQKKRRQHEENKTYITKPPNAFMLFMKEQRPNVGHEVHCKGSAAVNAFLGQKWRSLTEHEQAKYYYEAERLRLLHKQQHPEWSSSENYGKKCTTKERKRAAKRIKGLKLAPYLQPRVMEPHHSQAAMEKLPHTRVPPVCNMYNRPQVYEDGPAALLGDYSSWTDMLSSTNLLP